MGSTCRPVKNSSCRKVPLSSGSTTATSMDSMETFIGKISSLAIIRPSIWSMMSASIVSKRSLGAT